MHLKNIFQFGRGGCLAVGALLFGAIGAGSEAFAEEDVLKVEIAGIEGLQFSPARFAVRPGQAVELTLINRDEMQHNLLITKPGKREEVGQLAMKMGGEGFARGFIPDSDAVLFHTVVVMPEESQTIRFTAPDTEGVYPYVCTFPGHASVMFGAMYVTGNEAELPPLRDDPHLPLQAREEPRERQVHLHHQPKEAPRREIRRTFMPEAGPAAIAVHAGGNLSFVWDAGTCHLRYAWWGGFIDSERHWTGNQSELPEIQGHIYYRAGRDFPLRLGDPASTPERKFLGYRIVDELPVFEYTLDGQKVTQYITALEHETGLRMAFEIPEVSEPVYFVVNRNAGARFTSSGGEWKEGVLKLEPAEARSFSIILVERPGHEPLVYWPMDDDPWNDDRMRADARVEGSLAFIENEMNSGITGAELFGEATFAGWVKLQDAARENQFLFGQREREGERELSLRYQGDAGFVLRYPNANGGVSTAALDDARAPTSWNHFVLRISRGDIDVYMNGEKKGSFAHGELISDEPFTIGASHGEFHANALLDDFRLWNAAVEAEDLLELYQTQAEK